MTPDLREALRRIQELATSPAAGELAITLERIRIMAEAALVNEKP